MQPIPKHTTEEWVTLWNPWFSSSRACGKCYQEAGILQLFPRNRIYLFKKPHMSQLLSVPIITSAPDGLFAPRGGGRAPFAMVRTRGSADSENYSDGATDHSFADARASAPPPPRRATAIERAEHRSANLKKGAENGGRS